MLLVLLPPKLENVNQIHQKTNRKLDEVIFVSSRNMIRSKRESAILRYNK